MCHMCCIVCRRSWRSRTSPTVAAKSHEARGVALCNVVRAVSRCSVGASGGVVSGCVECASERCECVMCVGVSCSACLRQELLVGWVKLLASSF